MAITGQQIVFQQISQASATVQQAIRENPAKTLPKYIPAFNYLTLAEQEAVISAILSGWQPNGGWRPVTD